MSEVATLLAVARAAHARYREASGRIGKDGKVSQRPQLLACGAAVRDALKARVDAHALDPQQRDPAWREDEAAMKGQSNDALVDFYVPYLARAEAA